MILGKIFGKITTTDFQFIVENETRKFEFVQILHKVYDYVLAQVVEIERTEKDLARCIVIGYRDEKGRIKPIRIPFDQNAEVLKAEDSFIKSIIKLDDEQNGAFVGKLEGKDINVFLDLKKLLTKHICILAKSGAGKSYTVGVLTEEIIDKRVPILVIDPHGEYSSLRFPNDEEKESLKEYGLKPKGFRNIKEYGDSSLDASLTPLRLNSLLTPNEIIQLFPGKLSNSQTGLLYGALKHLDQINFTNVLLALEREENAAKWTLINNLDYLNNLNLFSDSYTSLNELVQVGKCSIINLKGIAPEVQEIIVYKLLKDLFEARKKEKIPPFFTVIEEAHNYCPERSFGETRCSKIIRTIASEGRKFGLGLCIVSQRPARVDKSVLSQCTTQIIMKVTNPNDLKTISTSVEGITAESESEIKNMSIGTCLITGVVDMPLFVSIRPRLTKHGGHAQEILEEVKSNFLEKVQDFEETDLLPIIRPKISIKDIKLMSDKPVTSIEIILVPAFLFVCNAKTGEFKLLVEAINGSLVVDVDNFRTKQFPELGKLDPVEIKILHAAFNLKNFSKVDLIKKGFSMESLDSLKHLVELGYLAVKAENFRLSDNYVLSQLSKHACYSDIEYLNVNYNMKKEAKIKVDTLKEKLSKFTNIIDQRDCFVLKYGMIYKNDTAKNYKSG